MSRPQGADAASVDTLLKIVKTANSKKAPGPQPLFPPADVDWHYDIIRQIEAGNPIIQAVRERQREFARRLKAQLAEQELETCLCSFGGMGIRRLDDNDSHGKGWYAVTIRELKMSDCF